MFQAASVVMIVLVPVTIVAVYKLMRKRPNYEYWVLAIVVLGAIEAVLQIVAQIGHMN